MAKICIIRGEHPNEVSAYLLAERVAKCLRELGDEVMLKEAPWRKGYYKNFRTFLPDNMPKDQYDLLYKTLSHNYPDFTRVTFHGDNGIMLFHYYRGSFPVKPEDVKFVDNDSYNKLVGPFAFYPSKMPEHVSHRVYIIYSIPSPPPPDEYCKRICLEIPCIGKEFTNPSVRALAREVSLDIGRVTDVKRTIEAGLMGPAIVDIIARGLDELVTKLS